MENTFFDIRLIFSLIDDAFVEILPQKSKLQIP